MSDAEDTKYLLTNHPSGTSCHLPQERRTLARQEILDHRIILGKGIGMVTGSVAAITDEDGTLLD